MKCASFAGSIEHGQLYNGDGDVLKRLEREHARIEDAIVRESRCRYPDEVEIARLKKQRLAIKDQTMLAQDKVQVSVAA